jgi:hypothetical protein
MKNKICKNCGYIGKPTTQGAGSFFVDALLWLVFTSFTLFSAFLPFLLFPLAWTIYHVATYSSITCPKCECLDMVGMKSRKGKQLLANRFARSEQFGQNKFYPLTGYSGHNRYVNTM